MFNNATKTKGIPAIMKSSTLLRPLLAATAISLLAGCANRDSITVGAVPDDYRTNHPIVIGEKEMTLAIPVAASDRGASRQQRASLEGFLDGYDRSAAPVLKILTPSGAANDLAASHAARDFSYIAMKNGVPKNRIVLASYQAASIEASEPVQVSFVAIRAQTDKCGRWPSDVLETSENKHYANFGCSYQNNIAAQVANPSDLLGPRKQTTIDAENRGVVIDDYRSGGNVLNSSEVDY